MARVRSVLVAAAERYRLERRRGYTIRFSLDFAFDEIACSFLDWCDEQGSKYPRRNHVPIRQRLAASAVLLLAALIIAGRLIP